MGLVEQAADGLEVARAQGVDGGVDARVLGQHVAGAPAPRLGQPLRRVARRLAQRAHPELARRRLALGAALVVARLGVLVRGAGVDRDELPAAQVERHRLDRERREVDPQRVALGAEQRRELVEQPGLGADPVVLDPRAELRQLDPVGLLGARHAEQGEAQRRLERRRGGQPGPAGDVAREGDAGRHELDAGGGELGHDAARERAPALGGLGAGEREGVGLAEILRDDLDAVAGERLGRGGDAAIDRERQREAAVVVGVLPDQVDAAGAARANRRRCRDRRRRRCRCRGRDGRAASARAWVPAWTRAAASRRPGRASRGRASAPAWPASCASAG